LDTAVVYLVPVGRERFELYSEAPDEAAPDTAPPSTDPAWRRTLHGLHERWRDLVQTASRSEPSAGWFARTRDRAICHAAESIAEQRTLWSLRHFTAATTVYSTELSDAGAISARTKILAHARRHHGRWLAVDTLLLIVSGVLALVPGPNILAYYFAFRVVGHYLSWRGARQAMDFTEWQQRPEPALAELGRLASVPRAARGDRVQAIAAQLNLPRLAAFFDRTAIE
jgi:hypothetical protein